MAYASTGEVAALVPRWANTSGVFDSTTRPQLSHVQTWLGQISAMVDSMLAQQGFTIPVTNATVKAALDLFVAEEVAALAEGVNNAGRFGPTAKQKGGASRYKIIMDDVAAFIEANAYGFTLAGAAVSATPGSQIGYRGTDNSGNDVAPIFQREAFGNQFTDWDAA